MDWNCYSMIVFKLIGMLFLFLFVSFLCSYPYIMCLNWLNTGRKEIFLMASVAFVLVIVQIGSLMDQSIEMACFVAGMLLASQRKLTEDIFHILTILGWCFNETHVVALRKSVGDVRRYLATLSQVVLVTHENGDYLVVDVLLELAQPVGQLVERGLIAHVVDDDNCVGASVIRLSYGSESFLASF